MTAIPALSGDSLDYHGGGRQILSMAYVDAMPGTVTALVGRSGAGKTTVLEILVGVRRPHYGWVACFGQSIAPSPGTAARHGIAFLPSRPWLPGHLTGQELMDLTIRIWGSEVREAIDHPDARDVLAARIDSLSGGERKQVEIAILFAGGATTLVLDEPFLHLDPIERDQVGRLLREHAANGAAILFADHDPHMTLAVADRLYRIERGQTTFVPDFRDRQVSEWYGRWGTERP
jgi:ABC-type multidrug transport system ATPase subunit